MKLFLTLLLLEPSIIPFDILYPYSSLLKELMIYGSQFLNVLATSINSGNKELFNELINVMRKVSAFSYLNFL